MTHSPLQKLILLMYTAKHWFTSLTETMTMTMHIKRVRCFLTAIGVLLSLLGLTSISVEVHRSGRRRLVLDPKTIEVKVEQLRFEHDKVDVKQGIDGTKEYPLPGHRPNHPHAGIMNGTLFIPRKAGELVCKDLLGIEPGTLNRLHYHFEDCYENQLGNRLGEHYGRYLLANAARIPYSMTCGSSEDQNPNQLLNRGDSIRFPSVLMQLSVWNERPGPIPTNKFGSPLSVVDMCHRCFVMNWGCRKGMEAITNTIRNDMAILASHPYSQSFEPDDAVIHVRLGDSLRGQHDEFIGLLPHKAYGALIAEAEKEKGEMKSISIVTQPFEVKFLRHFDRNATLIHTSELVARDLRDYLRNRFPGAIVKIDNSAETSMKSFARLIRAKKVAICGSSTFCTMPVLGVISALGYIYRAQRHSPWAALATDRYDNLRTWRAPRLANHIVPLMTEAELLHWLRTESETGNKVIDTFPFSREHFGFRAMQNSTIVRLHAESDTNLNKVN